MNLFADKTDVFVYLDKITFAYNKKINRSLIKLHYYRNVAVVEYLFNSNTTILSYKERNMSVVQPKETNLKQFY